MQHAGDVYNAVDTAPPAYATCRLRHRYVNAAGSASPGFARLLLGQHLCDGLDVDLRFHHRDRSSLGEGAAAEDHEAGAAREERVVLAHAHAAARVELRAALPDDDVARHHFFSGVRPAFVFRLVFPETRQNGQHTNPLLFVDRF